MSHDRLNVTLTATDNEYLQPRLPLRGEIEFYETGVEGTLISAIFRIWENGRLSAAVEVPRPSFTFGWEDNHAIFSERRATHAGNECVCGRNHVVGGTLWQEHHRTS